VNPVNLEISWESLLRIVVVGGVVVLAYIAKEAVVVLLLAIFISAALDNFVVKLEKFLPRLVATIIVYLSLITLVTLVFYAIIPVAILELKGALTNLSNLTSQFFGSGISIPVEQLINPNIDKIASLLLSGNTSSFFGVISKFLGGALFIIATLISSFYLTASRDGVGTFLADIFPEKLEEKVLNIYYRSKNKIGKWFQAQIILALTIGIVTFVGLSFTSIKYVFLLSIVAALFEVIPVVGPIFAGAVAVVIALTESVDLAIYVAIFYVIVQQIESHILVPLIMKKALDLHPVVILVSLLAGLEIAGPIGAILAVPTSVVLGEFVGDLVEEKKSRRNERQQE